MVIIGKKWWKSILLSEDDSIEVKQIIINKKIRLLRVLELVVHNSFRLLANPQSTFFTYGFLLEATLYSAILISAFSSNTGKPI